MTLMLNMDVLNAVARHTSSVAKKADSYANELTLKVANKIANVSGVDSGDLADARYFVKQKVAALKRKHDSYISFSSQVAALATTAKRVDGQVAKMLMNSQEKFLSSHKHLRIDSWKAAIFNWLTDLKNACPLFALIADAIDHAASQMNSLCQSIKHWYKCEGGKELVDFVLAIGGAILAVAIFVISLPASGFFAICAAIAAGITALNALNNVATQYLALHAAKNGDPAWARVYGKLDNASESLRFMNTNSRLGNWLTNGFAGVLDAVHTFCAVVGVVNLAANIAGKLGPIRNYFSQKGGLFSYMKEAKWDPKTHKMIVEDGIVKTRFTPRSIWNGTKAFVLDKLIHAYEAGGLRTVLNKNFVTDWNTAAKTFSISGLKDTFRYYRENKGIVRTLFSSDISKAAQAKSYFEAKDLIPSFKRLYSGTISFERLLSGKATFGDLNPVLPKSIADIEKLARGTGLNKVLGWSSP